VLTLLFTVPLLLGPTVCALVWKVLVAPSGGIVAQVLASAGLGYPDWTSSSAGARLLIAFVQVWTWGLVAGAAVSVLLDQEAERVRAIFLLDGGRPRYATAWTLWSTRREWTVLLLLALTVENLRAFETIHVLTSGGPGRATSTVAYTVFEKGFLTRADAANSGVEAMWVFTLIAINALAAGILLKVAGWWRLQDDKS
jgi:multiple sugar transport system permease protein